MNQPKCILHPDRVAATTVAHMLVCQECDERYQEEARKYLPLVKRDFYQRLLIADGSRYPLVQGTQKIRP